MIEDMNYQYSLLVDILAEMVVNYETRNELEERRK